MSGPVLHLMKGPTGPKRAGTPIGLGIILLIIAALVTVFVPALIAAIILGVMVSAVVCYVVMMAMPRSTQLSIMGAAIGISADASYAKLSDETPVTVANGLIRLADGLTKSIGLIAADAQVVVTNVTPQFVWSFILSTVVFMGLSFLVTHDG
jgi:hypothetical protein